MSEGGSPPSPTCLPSRSSRFGVRRRERRLAVRQGFEPWVELLIPYNGLANRRLQPLGHLTAVCKYTARKHLPDRDFSGGPTTVFQTAASTRFNRNASRFTLTEYELWAHSRRDIENARPTDGARCASLRFPLGRRSGPTPKSIAHKQPLGRVASSSARIAVARAATVRVV